MSANDPSPDDKRPAREPLQVRLPGFVADRDVRLGDVVTRVAATLGVRPCGGCAQRASALNRWVAFSSKRRP